MKCSECRFWVGRADVPRNADAIPDGFGECRIRAPVGGSITAYFSGKSKPGAAIMLSHPFAVSADDDWCGEFVSRA